MPISVACPSCGHSMRVKDEFAGRKIRCPKCTTVLVAEEIAQIVDDNEIDLEPLPTPVARQKPRAAPEPDLFAEDDVAPSRSKKSGPNIVGNNRGYSLGKPATRRDRDDDDDDVEELEEQPREYKRKKKTVRRRREAEPASSSGGGLVLLGIAMIIGAIVWFVVGWMNGTIFFYPPILAIIGFVNIVKGMTGQGD